MKKIVILSFALVMVMGCWSCNAQENSKKENSNASEKVEAYYFHFSARCYTCKNVEAKAKENIESLYGGKVSFQSVNLDDAASKSLAERLQVSGQTLMVVKGETKVILTNEGFMYAKSNPDKFKSIIKEKVDPLVN
jgi:hypothetical protein